MVYSFGEADRKKKKARIKLPENPDGLSREVLSRLEDIIKAKTRDGSLPCGVAFNIAKNAGVSKIAVGELADRLGIRISNCQISCFKYDKIIHETFEDAKVNEDILSRLLALKNNDNLTCLNVHDLARELNFTPMAVADVANARNLKIHDCQLGCF